MSTTSSKSPGTSAKRLLYCLSFIFAATVCLLLPQTEHALSLGAKPALAESLLLRPAAMLLPEGHDFWHTEGNQILDAQDHPVRISGMNWSGFETVQAVPGGLNSQDYREILRTVKANGYNTVRIPFSNEMVEAASVPDHISFRNANGTINADLQGLTSLEILDKIVAYSGQIGLKIILDNHRSEAGSSAEQSGLWYTPQYPEISWVEDWTSLARRYRGNSTVIGMDLRNEPHNADKGGSCWDCGGSNDWHLAAQRAGNAVLAVNPRLLIFVEGVDSYAGDTYWWGGNLEGVRRSPVRLAVPNRLVYSAHEYGPTEYAQPWFNASTSPSTLALIWRRHWGYISDAGIAPVWIGEFGTSNETADVQSSAPGSEGQWFSTLIQYFGSHPSLGWTYWGVNGEDRYGLLDGNYSTPANHLKAEALQSITHDASARIRTEVPNVAAPRMANSSAALATLESPSIAPFSLSRASGSVHDAIGQGTSRVVSYPGRNVTHGIDQRSERLRPAPKTRSSDLSVQTAIAASIHQAVSTANRSLVSQSEIGSE